MTLPELPTEAQCLASRIHEDARGLARDLLSLPTMTLIGAARVEDLCAGVERTAHAARRLEFDGARLASLADAQADRLERLHEMTVEMVDTCRFATTTRDHRPPPEEVVQLAHALLDMLAALQEELSDGATS